MFVHYKPEYLVRYTSPLPATSPPQHYRNLIFMYTSILGMITYKTLILDIIEPNPYLLLFSSYLSYLISMRF